MKDKRMAQVIDGRTISVGEILGGAAQDTNGAQLKFEQVRDSYPPVFEAIVWISHFVQHYPSNRLENTRS
jgi:hypothetical protein